MPAEDVRPSRAGQAAWPDAVRRQAGAQVLPNRRDAAAKADVAPAGGGPRLLQRGVNAFGDETKSVPPAIVSGGRG